MTLRAAFFLFPVCAACSAPAAAGAPAPGPTDYTLSFQPGEKLWRVEARCEGRGEEALDFWFPLWTPGAYHVAEFGRFVKEITARDEEGRELAVERAPDARSHVVVRGTKSAREVRIAYSAESISEGIFSHDVIDVESNRITPDYAYVNPVSLFGFVPARAHEPVRLTLALPEGWKVATVLPTDAEGRYLAPSYLRFEDSPFLFSPTLLTREFEVDGVPHAVSVHGKGAAELETIVGGCRRIVAAASKLMLGLPYDRYHFLFGFVPEGQGSGLEHSYSTLILTATGQSVDEADHGFWGITAHEFFHLWCAERIHVQEIQEPDLTRRFETGTLWVNEGVTEYFARHVLLHAGFLRPEELLETYLTTIPPELVRKESWTDVSRDAADWAGMGDLMRFALRMYAVGPATIFALDLTMRRATDGERGVLDLLRHLNEHYVKEGRGFGEDELDDILAAVGGPAAREFYARTIDGEELPEPAGLLDVIGYRFVDGELEELAEATPAQQRARADFFSVRGEP